VAERAFALLLLLSLWIPAAPFTLPFQVEDPRVRQLRDLLDEATKLQEHASTLIAELTDQLQRSIFTHDDRGVPAERRRGERRRKSRG
jgi:hypothetical protein